MKALLLALALALPIAAAGKPNFVLILADDCTWSDLFAHAPQPLHRPSSGEVRRVAEPHDGLRPCEEYRPPPAGRWLSHALVGEIPRRTEVGLSLRILRQGWPRSRTFLGECAGERKPFLLIVASNEPRSPHSKGDAGAYPPDRVKLSPIQADTPATRKALSAYFAEITCFDSQVGEVLAALGGKGLREDTFVIVLSEQGYDLPFAEWTCYDAGLKSACVIRWPGKVRPATATNAMVEYTDVVATFLDAVGLPVPGGLDGKSFLPVLLGKADVHRDFTCAQQTSKGIIRGPVHYGIRSIRGGRYRYIRNLTPEVIFKNAVTPGKVFQSWIRAGKNGNAHAAKLVKDFRRRPAEELYDCETDPWNRYNLIGDESLAPVAADLRKRLDAWMRSQGDEGQATEEKAPARMPRHAGK